jgi:hypothetical protein
MKLRHPSKDQKPCYLALVHKRHGGYNQSIPGPDINTLKMLASGSALKLKNLKAQVWYCRMQLFNRHCSLYIGLIT